MVQTTDDPPPSPQVGIVVIGRNEGERLKQCVASLVPTDVPFAYVDSGSTDGSAAWVRGRGHAAIELDASRPFTAARARNAGRAHLRATAPELAYVQFVDGDCELFPGWITTAARFLDGHPEVAAVAGRLRERRPEQSVYNRLCDIEWRAAEGEVRACGGIAMFRAAAFDAVRGFDESLIAGEEPELCLRLRASGGRIWRLDADMAWHDAAITSFGQWWRRTMRSGHAFAEGTHKHGQPPERHFVAETRRAVAWGLALPLVALAGAAWHPAALLLLLLYPLQVLRLYLLHRNDWAPAPLARAFFLVLGRLPEAQGICIFWLRNMRRAPRRLIEYK